MKLVTSLILSRLTTAILSFLVCLLPLSVAFVTFRTVRSPNPEEKKTKQEKHKTGRITSLFLSLHWLPTPQRIQCKINTFCCKCISHTVPSYLCDCLQVYNPPPTVLSALQLILSDSRFLVADFPLLVSSPFSVFGPSILNDLPLPLTETHTGLLQSSNLTSRHFFFSIQ